MTVHQDTRLPGLCVVPIILSFQKADTACHLGDDAIRLLLKILNVKGEKNKIWSQIQDNSPKRRPKQRLEPALRSEIQMNINSGDRYNRRIASLDKACPYWSCYSLA